MDVHQVEGRALAVPRISPRLPAVPGGGPGTAASRQGPESLHRRKGVKAGQNRRGTGHHKAVARQAPQELDQVPAEAPFG